MPRKSPRVSSPKAVALPSLSISLAAYSVTGMDILNSSSPSAPGSGQDYAMICLISIMLIRVGVGKR